MARSNLLWKESMGFVEILGSKVNEYSVIGEHKNVLH